MPIGGRKLVSIHIGKSELVIGSHAHLGGPERRRSQQDDEEKILPLMENRA
jgi:hypothetical protein